MESYKITIFSILLLISFTRLTSAYQAPAQTYKNFIKAKCSAATYPTLCIQTLTPFASTVQNKPLKLCIAALNVAIQGAQNASSTVTKIAKQKGISGYETAALKDCIGDMKDAVYELRDTLTAMGYLGGADRDFQWSNAKSRASAAITDSETCADGFSGRKTSPAVKAKIRSCVNGVEHLISNALYLINHLY